MYEKKETVSITGDYKDGLNDWDLVKLADWLSEFMDGHVDIQYIERDDNYEMLFIRTEG